MAHIAIIGAGITGVTTAHALLERGHRVTVIERERYPAMKTSYANGGQLSASNAEVWNSWATVLKGVRWMARKDAPLLIDPKLSFHKLGWLAAFCREVPNHRENTLQTVRLAMAARRHLLETAQAEDIAFDLEQRGILHFYHDESSFRTAERGNRLLCEGGLERFPVSAAEMREIEPALAGEFFAGFYTPSDMSGDVHKYTTGLAHACIRKGAQFWLQRSVTGIRSGPRGVVISSSDLDGTAHDPIAADAVVICAGVASRKFAAMVGERVNVYPVKGYSITVRMNDQDSQAAAPHVSLLDESAKIVTSRLGADRFRVAGTAEFNGENLDIRADRIKPLTDWVSRHFPRLSTREVIPWAGLRPMTPNMLPRVGAARRPGIFFNTGHGHLGWTLSAVTAQMVAFEVDEAFGPLRRFFPARPSPASQSVREASISAGA